jgi:hypothetical protein
MEELSLVTADNFRSLALEIPGALESSHMDHPDFRINGRVFASLGYPDRDYGMVKLTPEQQRAFMKEAPSVFVPCAGAWGKQGYTNVTLAAARVDVARAALAAASNGVSSEKKKEV